MPNNTPSPYYGITIGINPGIGVAGSPYPYWTQLFADMATLGLTWLRFQISWRNIELTAGTYTWTVLDDAVTRCNAQGINIMYTIRGAPTWAVTTTSQQATTEPYFLMDPTLAAGFATQVATRYNGNNGHGHIDAFGYNEDFSIHFTPTNSAITLNQVVTNATVYSSLTVLATGFDVAAGTQFQFGALGSSGQLFIVSTAAAAGSTSLSITAVGGGTFTANQTYATSSVITAEYFGLYNSKYSLYNGTAGITPGHKSQPTRDSHFASPIIKAVTPAIRAAYPGVKIGMPCVWWVQPLNTNLYPNSPSNYTAHLQTLYNDGCKGLFDWLDFHYYSNTANPNIGNPTCSTIAQAMNDLMNVATQNGDPNIPIYVTEFGWQVPNDCDVPTQNQRYKDVLAAIQPGNTRGNKAFFYTLDYATAPQQSSLIQWNGASYTYQPAFTSLQNYIAANPGVGTGGGGGGGGGGTPPPPSTNLQNYSVTIGGQVVYVIAGTLNVQNSVGRRGQASFKVKTDINTHFQQYQQVNIYDPNGVLVFSGYVTNPKEYKPGFQPSLIHDITCTDQHFIADKRVVAASYSNKTCGEIVQSLIQNILASEGVTVGQIFDGIPPNVTLYPATTLYPGGNIGLIPNATFFYATVAQAMDALVKAASSAGVPYYWMIDAQKKMWFVPYTSVVNSTLVDGSQIDMVKAPVSVIRANPTYRNIQYVVGGVAQTVTQTETRKGDGNTVAWPMGFDLATQPTITVNGVGKSVGIKGVTTGQNFYWQAGSPIITQDSAGTKLISTDTLQVVYIGQYPAAVISSNGAQIAFQQSLDGTTGIIEAVEADATLTSVSDGLTEASQLLTRYSTQGTILTFSTLTTGFTQGQLITVNLPMHSLFNAQMLIESVVASDQLDQLNIWYTVTAVLGPYDTTWTAFFSRLLAQKAPAESINVGVSQSVALLAPFFVSVAPSVKLTVYNYACPVVSTTLFPNTNLIPC